MKTILVLTDFSISADYTADYALGLAQSINANLLLCNIYERSANETVPNPKAWPKQACEEDSINDLGSLMARLKTKLDKGAAKGYKPEIEQCSIDGLNNRDLAAIVTKHQISLAVISAHSRHSYGGLFQKNHAWEIIDNATFPVMVIPYQTKFKPYRQIAFATGMQHTDIPVLGSVSTIASYSNSEVLITHVTAKHQDKNDLQRFFNQIPLNMAYPQLSYHSIQGNNIVRFLKQQCDRIDLLVLIHYKRSFLQNIFSQSVTRKMAAHPRKPLLIFPQNVIN